MIIDWHTNLWLEEHLDAKTRAGMARSSLGRSTDGTPISRATCAGNSARNGFAARFGRPKVVVIGLGRIGRTICAK